MADVAIGTESHNTAIHKISGARTERHGGPDIYSKKDKGERLEQDNKLEIHRGTSVWNREDPNGGKGLAGKETKRRIAHHGREPSRKGRVHRSDFVSESIRLYEIRKCKDDGINDKQKVERPAIYISPDSTRGRERLSPHPARQNRGV